MLATGWPVFLPRPAGFGRTGVDRSGAGFERGAELELEPDLELEASRSAVAARRCIWKER